MLLLSGTIPTRYDSITVGRVNYDNGVMKIGNMEVPTEALSIGATAMMAAASKAAEVVDMEAPMSVVAGDLGEGSGSRAVYKFLSEEAGGLGASTVTVHYILPLRNEFMDFIEMADYWEKRPFLIADAGALLIAKATKSCQKFDLFTPDAGEISFLADSAAAHPAYVDSALFEVDTTEVPKLINRAYSMNNTPRYLLVKGPVDYVVENGKILHTVSQPNIPALEPIGGTGDTITGMASALISSGIDPVRASLIALRANRLAGQLSNPNPSTRIFKIIDQIEEALQSIIDHT